jgi:hypothetical protein
VNWEQREALVLNFVKTVESLTKETFTFNPLKVKRDVNMDNMDNMKQNIFTL